MREPIASSDFEEGVAFLKAYASIHSLFNGGDVLLAWRKTGYEGAQHNWRNVWPGVIKVGERRHWIRKVGRIKPVSPQSHTKTLALWRSNLCEIKGSRRTASVFLGDLKKQFYLRDIDFMAALWAAYEYGIEKGKK